jgi:acyl carrier protein
VNPDRSFFDYGLDSLGTLQLLIALEADTGIRLRAVEATTVRALAETLSAAMLEMQPVGADALD